MEGKGLPMKINVCVANEKRIASVTAKFLDSEFADIAGEGGFYFRKTLDFFEASTCDGIFLAEYTITKTDSAVGIREEGAFTPSRNRA